MFDVFGDFRFLGVSLTADFENGSNFSANLEPKVLDTVLWSGRLRIKQIWLKRKYLLPGFQLYSVSCHLRIERLTFIPPYYSSYEPLHNVPIVTGATAWTCPIIDKTYELVFNESLYYRKNLSLRNNSTGYIGIIHSINKQD